MIINHIFECYLHLELDVFVLLDLQLDVFLERLLELLVFLELFLAVFLALAIYLITTCYYYALNNINNSYNYYMEIIGPLMLSFIAGMSTILGSVFIFFNIKRINEFISMSLSFSFIIILSISIFDLIPNSIYILIMQYKVFLGCILILLSFLLGNICFTLINLKIGNKNDNLYRVGILSLITLLIHNIPEGLAVFMSAYSNMNIGIKICIAIMLHNIPEGIIISIPLYHSGIKKSKVLLYTFISGIVEPIGGLLGYILLKDVINDSILSIILLFVSGLMINLAIKDILKEALKYKKYNYMCYGILLGTLLFVISLLI